MSLRWLAFDLSETGAEGRRETSVQAIDSFLYFCKSHPEFLKSLQHSKTLAAGVERNKNPKKCSSEKRRIQSLRHYAAWNLYALLVDNIIFVKFMKLLLL